MKILITGGAGYIGSALFQHLILKGHRTVDTVDLTPGDFTSHPGDYRSLTASFLAQYDTIIHLAGHSSVARCKQDRWGAVDNNIVGFIGLLAKMTGQCFIYASSSSVYSQADKNVYDFSKQACDDAAVLLRPHCHFWGLRFGTVNGPSPNMRRDLVVNSMVEAALHIGEVHVRNEHVRRPILGIKDLCRAIDTIMSGAVDSASVCNVSSFNTSIWAIAQEVAEQTKCQIKHLPDTPTYDFTMQIDKRFMHRETLHSIVRDLIEKTTP